MLEINVFAMRAGASQTWNIDPKQNYLKILDVYQNQSHFEIKL